MDNNMSNIKEINDDNMDMNLENNNSFERNEMERLEQIKRDQFSKNYIIIYSITT